MKGAPMLRQEGRWESDDCRIELGTMRNEHLACIGERAGGREAWKLASKSASVEQL